MEVSFFVVQVAGLELREMALAANRSRYFCYLLKEGKVKP